MRGPDFQTLDLGLMKTFNLGPRVRTQFRLEAFNALNRANFNNPGGQPLVGQLRPHHLGGGSTDPAGGAPDLVLRIDACRNALP